MYIKYTFFISNDNTPVFCIISSDLIIYVYGLTGSDKMGKPSRSKTRKRASLSPEGPWKNMEKGLN